MSTIRGLFTAAAKATIWRSGAEDFHGDTTYTRLAVIDCTYTSNTVLQSDAAGREFRPAFAIYTKSNIAKEGDLIIIGASNEAAPPEAAKEVRRIATAAPMFGTPDYDIFVG